MYVLLRPFQLKLIPVFAAGVLAAIGAGALVGWASGYEPLMTVLPGLIRMKPNTAAAFVFAAMALYLADARKHRAAQAVCATAVAILGLTVLAEYIWEIDAHLDQLLFRDPVQSIYPGRMAHFSAALFLLSGLMLYPMRTRISEIISQILALCVGFASLFAIVGYLYGVPLLYGSVSYTAMAVHTGLGFLILSFGYLSIQNRHGFAKIFRSTTVGGVIVRRLVPLAILVPIIVGAVFSRVNFGQLKLGIAAIVLCNILFIVGALWGLAWILDKSEKERGAAQLASEMDALTGIHNRRYFDLRLREEVHRCVRHCRSSCLLLFDIDKFKIINDRFGHVCGDEVIQIIARECARSLRVTDIFCRYGGEEFVIIAPETAGADGMILARKVRELVSTINFEKVAEIITVSIGVAQIGRGLDTPELTIASADRALYTAKRMGRNRECLDGHIEQSALQLTH